MKVRIKKLHPDAVIPSYAKEGDAGLDLTTISLERTDYYDEYGTGLVIEIPEGYVGLIFPRSSISKKTQTLTNSVGVIDSGYRGEIKFRFKYLSQFDLDWNMYKIGEKIGQLMIIPYPKIELEEVKELSSSERGTGRFGSTDNVPTDEQMDFLKKNGGTYHG